MSCEHVPKLFPDQRIIRPRLHSGAVQPRQQAANHLDDLPSCHGRWTKIPRLFPLIFLRDHITTKGDVSTVDTRFAASNIILLVNREKIGSCQSAVNHLSLTPSAPPGDANGERHVCANTGQALRRTGGQKVGVSSSSTDDEDRGAITAEGAWLAHRRPSDPASEIDCN